MDGKILTKIITNLQDFNIDSVAIYSAFNDRFKTMLDNDVTLENSIKQLDAKVIEVQRIQTDKIELVISEVLPDIEQRKSNTLYFKITDVVSNGTGADLKVSPLMGVKII